jgi:hypothetical protein
MPLSDAMREVLNRLPSAEQVAAQRVGKPIKRVEQSRADDKRERLAEEAKADEVARDKAWKRCEGRCEKCSKRVKRGGGLLHGAHFHHRIPKAHGGRKNPIYLVTCYDCHFDGPSGAHTRSR